MAVKQIESNNFTEIQTETTGLEKKPGRGPRRVKAHNPL